MRQLLRLRRLAVEQAWGVPRPRHLHCSPVRNSGALGSSAGEYPPNTSADALASSSYQNAPAFEDDTFIPEDAESIPNHTTSSTTAGSSKPTSSTSNLDVELPSFHGKSSAYKNLSYRARYMSEEQLLNNLTEHLQGAPYLGDFPGIQGAANRRINHADTTWRLYSRLPEATRQGLSPDFLRLILRSVVPVEVPSVTRTKRHDSQSALSRRYNERLRLVMTDLSGTDSPPTVTDWAVSMHRLAMLGDVPAVKAIYEELSQVSSSVQDEGGGNEKIRVEIFKIRLRAIEAWCKAIDAAPEISVKKAWSMDIESRNKLTGEKFGEGSTKEAKKADKERTISPIVEQQVRLVGDEVLELLWKTLEDFNTHPESMDNELVLQTLGTINLVRHVMTHHKDKGSLNKLLEDLLKGAFGIDLTYLIRRSDTPDDLPKLDKGGVRVLVEYYGRKRSVYKMIAAMEIFGQPEDSTIASAGENGAPNNADHHYGTPDRDFFSSTEEEEASTQNQRSVKSVPEEALDDSPRTAADFGYSSDVNAMVEEPVTRSHGLSCNTILDDTESRSSARVYADFYPLAPTPFALVASILPTQSNLSPNIHTYPIERNLPNGMQSSSSNLVDTLTFSRMLDLARSPTDVDGLLTVLQMYVEAAAQDQATFLRSVLRPTGTLALENVGKSSDATSQSAKQDLQPLAGSSSPSQQTTDLQAPSTLFSSFVIVKAQAYLRKVYRINDKTRKRYLSRVQAILKDVKQRLFEEHILLTGREPAALAFSPADYLSIMRQTPIIRSNAPFEDLLTNSLNYQQSDNTASGSGGSGVARDAIIPLSAFAPLRPRSLVGEERQFEPRAYLCYVSLMYSRVSSLLEVSQGQGGIVQVRKVRRRRSKVARKQILRDHRYRIMEEENAEEMGGPGRNTRIEKHGDDEHSQSEQREEEEEEEERIASRS